MAMVVRANRIDDGIGGHISTYASAATLLAAKDALEFSSGLTFQQFTRNRLHQNAIFKSIEIILVRRQADQGVVFSMMKRTEYPGVEHHGSQVNLTFLLSTI